MAKNVMKMLKPSPKRGKNAFDLSHRHVLGAKFGELLPITCLETVPGDYFEVNCADLLRAMPMVTSPFLRAKQHIDFWFVPYTDLWHQFNSFITMKSQPQSSALQDADFVPHVNIVDIQTAFDDAYADGLTDIHGIAYTVGAKKLFDLLGYGKYNVTAGTGQNMPDVNVWRIAAYNYIWYNEYRQQYYDVGDRLLDNNNQNASYLFNFDDLLCDAYANADLYDGTTTSEQRIQAMFQMRYRCWKKDLYTGLMPSTQFGNVSAVDVSLPSELILSNKASSASVGGKYAFAGPNSSVLGIDDGTGQFVSSSAVWVPKLSNASVSSNFDILAFRRSQAVQIWRENALRSGNRINDNMRGHYGEIPSYQRDHRPTYIGSYDAVLNISDVNATAQTGTGGNQALGDVAGKGLSSLDSKKLKFQCNDFGVIMGIFSVLPEAEYNSDGIERANQLLDRYDYFSPEMENLGLEAVSSLNFMTSVRENARVIGYAPRYYGYKTKLDKCFGEFTTGGSLQIWCSPKYDVRVAVSNNYAAIALSTLYVNPNIFNVNFVSDVDVIGEQVLCDFFFNVEAVRPMTVLGLPTV